MSYKIKDNCLKNILEQTETGYRAIIVWDKNWKEWKTEIEDAISKSPDYKLCERYVTKNQVVVAEKKKKMLTCPICEKEIYCLRYVGKETVIADFTCDEPFKKVEYSNWESAEVVEYINPQYCCSECEEVLFDNEKDATEFIKTGKIPENRVPYLVERKLLR